MKKQPKGAEVMNTTAQAATQLGVSTRRVRQMIVAGDMDATKAGRDFLIPQSEVERAKNRKTAPGPAPAKKAGNK